MHQGRWPEHRWTHWNWPENGWCGLHLPLDTEVSQPRLSFRSRPGSSAARLFASQTFSFGRASLPGRRRGRRILAVSSMT